MHDGTDLPRRISYWREVAGLRPVDLARKLGMSEASVSRWEGGTATPSFSSLQKIAGACGVTMSTFWSQLPEKSDA